MIRGVLRIVALAALAAAGLLSREALIERQPATGMIAPDDAPTSLFGVLVLGGFRPVYLEMLWSRADALAREGRVWELIDVHERIARLDPDNPRVRAAQAFVLAFDLGRAEPDARERWRLVRRALLHLDRGLARTPSDERLLELRFLVWFRMIAPDPDLSRRAARDLGMDGLEGALRAAHAFRVAHPAIEGAWAHEVTAAEEAIEALLNRGRLADARRAALVTRELAGDADAAFPGSVWGARAAFLARVEAVLERLDAATDWSAVAAGAASAERDDAALDDAVAGVLELVAALPAGAAEEETFTGALAALIQFRCMELAQALALAGRPGAALSALERVRRIARLAAGRLGPRLPYYTEAYVEAFAALLETDRAYRLAVEGPGTPSEELESRWSRGLDELDRLLEERAGVTDRFTRRLRARAGR